VSEESRLQSQTQVNLGRGLYAQEHNVQGAIVAWERAIRLDPDNAEAQLYLGQVLMVQGSNQRAEQLLRRAIELYGRQAPENENLRSPLAEARNTLGVLCMNTSRFDEALALFQQVTQEVTYTSQFLAWGNLGWAYQHKGSHREAVTALQRSVVIEPRFCVGWQRLGESYYQLDDHAHALEALNHSLDDSQQECVRNQVAWLARARVRVRLHQTEQVGEDIRHCVELDAASTEGRACAELGRSVTP
jgi:type IV pilus assembly protein PilF